MAWFWNRSVRSITCRPDEISYLIDESVRRQPTPLAKAVYLSKQGPLQKYWSTGVAEWWRQHGKEIANASKNLLLTKHAVSILELHGYSDDKSLPHMQELQTIFKSLQLTFEGSYGTPKRVAEQIEIYERITA